MSLSETIDITPNPRILRVLGEIPFQPWQCVAELVDNSLDAFAKSRREGKLVEGARIDIFWSGDNVAASERVLEVADNGQGMEFKSITNAVKAGYTSNDPTSSLGLFGMGFNIATARLGETTTLSSTRAEDSAWTGVEIDFDTLVKNHAFAAAVVRQEKTGTEQSGTKVQVSKLKEGVYRHLRDRSRDLKRTLEDVYAPILREGGVSIFINGMVLNPRPYCVWGEARAVGRRKEIIPTRVRIDRDLGSVLFDVERNQYLPGALEADYRARKAAGEGFPSGIIERPRRMRGWIGIQRYADPNDFGLDFVRNGRKILIKNKNLFLWENPFTGESILEYPIELGSTQGGRIVGELHVDYLIPTYQKNDFDRTEAVWNETVLAIRGEGPMLPKRREAFGLSQKADAPLARLVNAYRRLDPGTKNLAVAPSAAKEWARAFYRGDEAYATDDKWWQAAVETDREKADQGAGTASDVDEGTQPSDDPNSYSPSAVTFPALPAVQTDKESSTLDELILNSQEVVSLSGEYRYGKTAPLKVCTHEVREDTQIKQAGEKVPAIFFQDANECDFFYNPRHPLLKEFPLSARDLLTLYVAEKLKARDNVKDLVAVFGGLYREKFSDSRIERTTLQEHAERITDDIRSGMVEQLAAKATNVLEFIYEASGEVEDTLGKLLEEPDLIGAFQRREPAAIRILESVPPRTLARVVDRFPEDLFDNKLFRMPFSGISFGDEKATARARGEAKKKLLSYLEDAIALTSGGMSHASKDELGRASYSLSFLERMMVG